jgi:hypothetical protein
MADGAEPAAQAAECRACPICAGLAALRQSRPEAVEHLAKAGAELLLAARALLEAAAAPDQPPTRPRSRRSRPPANPSGDGGVQRIDVR